MILRIEAEMITVRFLLPLLGCLSVCSLAWSQGQSDYSLKALAGATSVAYQFTHKIIDPQCSFAMTIESDAQELIKKIDNAGLKKQRVIAPENLPDLFVNVLLETSSRRVGESQRICATLVKLEVTSLLTARLQHWNAPDILLVRIYQEVAYGASLPERVSEEINATAQNLMARFGMTYIYAKKL